MKIDRASIVDECTFLTSRSGGKGGQHVNKVETKVTVKFDLVNSELFSEAIKEKLLIKLNHKLSQGVLILSSETTRSQLRNKDAVIDKLIKLLVDTLKVPKKRIPTKISKAKKAERLEKKKNLSQKKSLRKNPRKEDY